MTSGSIIDTTFVEKLQQRNTKKENEAIKNGKTPDKEGDKPGSPSK